MPESIADFINELSQQNVPGLWNMYGMNLDTTLEPLYVLKARREILKKYLTPRVGVPYALIGLAPGYAGARFSGVPFNDEAHVFAEYDVRLSKRFQPWQEETASVVQATLKQLDIILRTVCWNAIPFHPFNNGSPLANRTPTWDEVEKHGLPWLERFLSVMKPGTVIPVGRIAERALQELDVPRASYVRHPSHGGAALFKRGLVNIVNGTNAEEIESGEGSGQHPPRGREEGRLLKGAES